MEKYYNELIIKPDSYYELFLDLVLSLTEDAIEEQNDCIIVRSEESLEDIKEGVEAFASELSSAFGTPISCEMSLETKENQDWISIYQQSVQPVSVGGFYIHPSWNDPQSGKINITVDPTLAFGSGHHATTATCLEGVEKYVKKGDTVCDVGTGSGILAIAAAKLGAVVDICDTDKIAVEDALKNFKLNDVAVRKSWEGSAHSTSEKYDVVIANIVADVLVMISRDLKKIVKSDGILILSGIMEQHLPKVEKKFSDLEIVEKIQQSEWVTLIVKGNNEQ